MDSSEISSGTVLGGASKPVVPPWQNISLPQQASEASIAANSAALPASESLVSSSNSFLSRPNLKDVGAGYSGLQQHRRLRVIQH